MRKSPRSISKIIIPALIIGFVGLTLFLVPRLIKISKIECKSQYGDCPPELEAGMWRLESGNLANAKKETANILDSNLLVSGYSTQYTFPDKLKVNILLKKARFAVFNKDTGRYLLIGSEGEILGSAENTSLPYVVQRSDTPNLFALSLMEGVFAMYQIGVGEMVDDSLVVVLPSGKRVIFPLGGNKDKEVLLGSLRLIYSQVQDKEIDLRFGSPVLR